jgi:hypothetical protein
VLLVVAVSSAMALGGRFRVGRRVVVLAVVLVLMCMPHDECYLHSQLTKINQRFIVQAAGG